jgi:cell division septation protein DedD
MGLRIAGALLLAAMQGALLAGCAEFSANNTAGAPVYAMATQEPVMVEQPPPEMPPVQNANPPQGKYGVQLAAPRSVEEARALIDTMRARYPNDLAQQWAEILPVTLPKGVFYRVVIGPLASEQQASQLCSRLRSQGAECFLRRG